MRNRIVSVCLVLALVLSMFSAMTVEPASAATVKPNIMGDLNGDGVLNTVDARNYLKKTLAGATFTGTMATLADLNGDGNFGTQDVRMMVQLALQPDEKTPTRAFWVPYMEVESMLSSGNIATSKAAIDACMQDCADRGTNVVYFHVRANSDAYYKSSLYNYNWRAKPLINAGFDPLSYAIQSAHAKGMELHAWVNPYRIGSSSDNAKLTAIFYKGNKYYYIPSDASVKELVVGGVRELVENYDIDGIQFDDYFYPEGLMSTDGPETFEQTDYNASGFSDIGDFRRNAVNDLLSSCWKVCHSREGCVFGISPSYNFESNYNKMYADAAYWAKTPGHVDYLAPQIYVGFNHQYSPFTKIVENWHTLPRLHTVDLIAGLAYYKTGLLDDTWAGSAAKTEWLNNNDMMSRQIAVVASYDWAGVALYGHHSLTVDSTRDATVAKADMASACDAWMLFN